MFADEEKKQQRIQICIACPKMVFSKIMQVAKCSECHCFIKAKTSLDSSSCPLGKW